MKAIITYYSGSNNCWKIYSDKAIYEPMTPAMSSSGFYSGGTPKETTVSADELSALENIVKNAFAATAEHQENRTKGSGLLEFEDKSVILNMNSGIKNQIEQMLNTLFIQ